MSFYEVNKSISLDTGIRNKKRKKETQKNIPAHHFDIKSLFKRSKKELGPKWQVLKHNGPIFSSPYRSLPQKVHFKYKGIPLKLTKKAEECMTFYAKILHEAYAKKPKFIKNFFSDWRNLMTQSERQRIRVFHLCDFSDVHKYFQNLARQKQQVSPMEKLALRQKQIDFQAKYGYCIWDGQKEKICNFCVEPPGLFRGRGNHPKMGKLKKRIEPEDVVINCSANAPIPVPPSGHQWKEVIHNPYVMWLASWVDSVSGVHKYIMLNSSSRVKCKKDFQKYETARRLKSCISLIRRNYTKDMMSCNILTRQRAVVLYFIDRLALRAGNEKGDGSGTVGCCSLRCKHVTLHRKMIGKKGVVELNFLGKDSVPYHNIVSVPKQVYRNLILFKRNKVGTEKIFDRLNTTHVNKYLRSLMVGLTAKVFRTYNASLTLEVMLKKYTKACSHDITSKLWAYNRANREVAVLCNHQRTPSKHFNHQLKNVKEKIKKKMQEIKVCQQATAKPSVSCNARINYKSKKKLVEAKKKKKKQLIYQLLRLRIQASDRVDNKSISLGTSKVNYLDPRITVAWCLRNKVPIEKVYSKAQRDKFDWAIKSADKFFVF